jgi:prophage regulatory protein
MENEPLAATLPTTFHPEQRLKLAVIEALTGSKKSKIYADVAAGKFPPPERDGRRFSRWRAGTVLDFLQARAESKQ